MECPFHNVRAFFSQPLNIVRTKSPQRVCTNEYSNRKQGRYSTLTSDYVNCLSIILKEAYLLQTNLSHACSMYSLLVLGVKQKSNNNIFSMMMRVTDDLTNAVINDFLIDMNKLPALHRKRCKLILS
jgi:phosphomevalonate kinase